MGFFSRSKKEIPAELPDLALEEPGKHSDLAVVENTFEQPLFPDKPKVQFQNQTPSEQKNQEEDEEKGFFKDIIGNLLKETKNIEKVESFYNNRFLEEDIVHQMKSYWEEQKPEIMLKNVGKDLKIKIAEKSNRLHKLEKEWQDIYFALLSKEEEIRADEKDLKESISEFISVCKKASKKSKKIN